MIDTSFRRKVGEELISLVNSESSSVAISRWADDIYSNHCRELDPSSDSIILKISCMQHGSQFELTETELRYLANQLISAGEKEELSIPNPEIQEIAHDLGENWLMCPLCQEIWKNHSKYKTVRCPKCKSDNQFSIAGNKVKTVIPGGK